MDAPLYLTTYLAIGALAGLLAGLLGVGGGLVIVPGLTVVLAARGLPADALVHTAVGTSLAVITVTSVASTHAHHRMGRVNWGRVRRLAPGLAAGAVAGAALARLLPGGGLRLVVGLFELVVALRIAVQPRLVSAETAPRGPESPLVGGAIGTVSALVGIGGGTLTVPYLLRRRVGIHEAIATSAACGLPIALAGTLGFVAFGWHDPQAAGLGYVLLPAFLPVAAGSMVMAPLGARLAHRLSGPVLKRVFAVFLAGAGVLMLAG